MIHLLAGGPALALVVLASAADPSGTPGTPPGGASSASGNASATPAAGPGSPVLAPPLGERVAVVLEAAEGLGDQADALADDMAEALHQTRRLAPVTQKEVVRFLTLEQQRQLLGCDRPECFANLGDTLTARYVVAGHLSRDGAGLRLALQLLDTTQPTVLNRAVRHLAADPTAAGLQARAAARVLVRPLLALASGEMLVDVSEEDAKVLVDERLVGLSPLKAMTLDGGLHTLRVELDGFRPVERDVNVLPAEVVAEQVRLIPSQAFVEAYRQRVTGRRNLGIGLAAAGAAIAGVAAGLYGWEQGNANGLANDIVAFNAGPRTDAARRADLDARRQEIVARATVWLVSGLVGLVTGGTGAYFWATAGDPDRYPAFR